jgi:tripartite-type tricarboxylate transporter receptor subunit TctC
MRWKGAFVAAIALAPIALAPIALAPIALEANAQKWPARPIEMIIPFPAGSGVDVIGRAVASAMADQSGQQVVVNNRDGASGTIGFNALAAATPDGSTIAFGPTTPIANAPYPVKGVRYRVESFDYLCQIFENVFTIAVTPQSKFKSVHDLITAAREDPGKLTYGHAGTAPFRIWRSRTSPRLLS